MAQEERETMELDVLFIGAGPANLSAAYRLKKNIDAHNIQAKSAGGKTIDEPMILVIDKGSAVGSHTLSGADVDPIAFRELFPELKTEDYPFMAPVVGDETYFLTATGKIPVPGFLVPPEMHSTGCHIGSISEMCRWLAKKCEEVGVEVYTEFAATELIREGEAILGAKIGDKGLDKDGNPGEGFAPGMDLMAKVTVLGEGTRGYLADQLISDFRLNEGADPQVWGLGLKEIIEIPAGRIRRGQVIHTFGYPLDLSTYGGSFVYALSDTLLSVGLVFGLDYKNPLLHSHDMFLKLKGHPLISSLIAGGKVLEYGAKTLPEGGLSALPKLSVNGAVLVGDSAGFLTTMRLKGVHLAMKSGMMAADRISRALVSGDFSAASLDYRQDFDVSWGGKELQRSRDFRQGFHGGLIAGMMNTGLGMVHRRRSLAGASQIGSGLRNSSQGFGTRCAAREI